MESLYEELKGNSGVKRWNKRDCIYQAPIKTWLFTLSKGRLTEEQFLQIIEIMNIPPNINYSIKINDEKECMVFHDITTHQTTRTAIILYSSGYIKIIEGKEYKK
jgi:hypothetical protein